MGIHEMQTVTHVIFAGVVAYLAMAREFEIDPVAMPADGVADHPYAIAFPEMHAIAVGRFPSAQTGERVPFDAGPPRLGAVDAEKVLLETVARDDHVGRAGDPHSA